MSADATGFVFGYSPLKGAAFAVHLAVADSVNDQHGNEFWMTVGKLSTKARVSHRATRAALAEAVSLGLLREVGADTRNRYAPRRYRFLFPDLACVYGCREETVDPDDGADMHRLPPSDPGGNDVPNERTTGTDEWKSGADERTHVPTEPNRTQDVTQTDPNQLIRAPLDLCDLFEQFWAKYPRKTAKGTARAVWAKAVAAAGDAEQIIDGAARYAADPNRDPAFTAHAATWLNAERWTDEPLPSRLRPANGKPAEFDPDKGIITDRSGPSRVEHW